MGTPLRFGYDAVTVDVAGRELVEDAGALVVRVVMTVREEDVFVACVDEAALPVLDVDPSGLEEVVDWAAVATKCHMNNVKPSRVSIVEE